MGRLIIVSLPFLLLVPACGLDLGDAPFYCCVNCNPQCPDGYQCKGTYCVKDGECPDTIPACKTSGNCGNGTCDTGETCTSCEVDCGKCKCGNGTCDTGETCTSCLQDCGACGTCNNNGTCDSGETTTSCPKDCPGTSCNNNGKCEAGETAASCPEDCTGGACTGDQTQCVDKTTLKYCESSTWKQATCNSLCVQGGFAYSAGCEFDSSKSKDVCSCGNYSKFGELCNDKVKCDPTLFCGTFNSATVGFCSKYCTTAGSTCPGNPSGTKAMCALDVGGKYACGFMCDYPFSCPTGLKCDSLTSLCKP